MGSLDQQESEQAGGGTVNELDGQPAGKGLGSVRAEPGLPRKCSGEQAEQTPASDCQSEKQADPLLLESILGHTLRQPCAGTPPVLSF